MHSLSSVLCFLGAVALVANAAPAVPVNDTRLAVSSRSGVTTLSSQLLTPSQSIVSSPATLTSQGVQISPGATSLSNLSSALGGVVSFAPTASPQTSGLLGGVLSSVQTSGALGGVQSSAQASGLLGDIQTVGSPFALSDNISPVTSPISTGRPVSMKATVVTVLIPVEVTGSPDAGLATPGSAAAVKELSGIISDFSAPAQATPTEAGSLGSVVSAQGSLVSAIQASAASAVATAVQQLTKEMGFIVPLSTSAAAVATAVPAQASSAAIPAATPTPTNSMIGVNTLLKQVNSFVAASNGSSASDFPSAQANARNVADCASVQSEMEKLLNSGILKQDGTLNSTASMGLPITKTGNGQFVVGDSDIELVSHQGSSLAFQIFRAADECDVAGTRGNLTSTTNSTGKRSIGGILCWLARSL